MSTQILYTCPCCERTGFMLQGLKRHRCRAKPKVESLYGRIMEHPRLTQEEIKKAVKNATNNARP